MRRLSGIFLAGGLLFIAVPPLSALTVEMALVDSSGVGNLVGVINVTETAYGTVFTPNLRGLAPGRHGFHLHQNPSCEVGIKAGKIVPALKAGGHYDPAGSNRHATPWGNGHLGDLPALSVNAEGRATTPVLAPRLKLTDLHERSLMIHAGGDNYSDQPNKLGGGGSRVACGTIAGAK